jgi:hypothetical protein
VLWSYAVSYTHVNGCLITSSNLCMQIPTSAHPMSVSAPDDSVWYHCQPMAAIAVHHNTCSTQPGVVTPNRKVSHVSYMPTLPGVNEPCSQSRWCHHSQATQLLVSNLKDHSTMLRAILVPKHIFQQSRSSTCAVHDFKANFYGVFPLFPLLWCFQSTLLGVPASALYNPNRESRTIWASKLLQSPFLAQDCVHFVWCMPSEMANGLHVTPTLKKHPGCNVATAAALNSGWCQQPCHSWRRLPLL